MATDHRHSGASTLLEERRLTRREIHGTGRRSPWRRRLAIGLVAVVALVGGGLAFASWRFNANITKIDVSSALGTDRPAAPTEAVNLLLIGSDTREGEGNDAIGKVTAEPGNHSDTNLLVHLSADRSWATVVSIPRDSMVPAPPECSPDAPREEWVVRQWNRNYTKGGPGCLIRTVEGNTGIFVDHYAVVDFRGFQTMVDALGGVEVCTPAAIDDRDSGLRLTPGRHTLEGEQALAYVRTRKSLGDGSDLGRIERQQAFLASVMQEATSSELLVQPNRLYAFLDAATKSLTTDPDFGVGTMRDLATSVRGIGLDAIEFVTVPTEPYPADLNRVQWKPAAEQIWTALREDKRPGEPETGPSPAPSGSATPLTVSPDEIAVRVVNATGVPGLAGQARRALTVQGFQGVTTSNEAVGPKGAVVEYSGEYAEAARTVAAAFPGARVKKASGLGSTVRVVLGTDAPDVVELPNRLGTEPLPEAVIKASPTPAESIPTRKATGDICS
ncbi:LCP family protein [Oryzobacter sp. R7]|uniref:LCP family protein n=1 Tax=Oryzobacter faecalis TaxID=3388656 RepID=UPI00398D1FFE